MSSTEIILQDLIDGNFRLTFHAAQRMNERQITQDDIKSCAQSAVIYRLNDGKFKVKGFGVDGEVVDLVCVYKDGVLIITVF